MIVGWKTKVSESRLKLVKDASQLVRALGDAYPHHSWITEAREHADALQLYVEGNELDFLHFVKHAFNRVLCDVAEETHRYVYVLGLHEFNFGAGLNDQRLSFRKLVPYDWGVNVERHEAPDGL